MNKVILFVLCLLFSSVSAQAENAQNAPTLNVIDPTVLSKMNDSEKLAVLRAVELTNSNAAGNKTLEEKINSATQVVNSIGAFESSNFVNVANNAADAIVAFCSKLGLAVKEVLTSETGGDIVFYGVLVYLLTSGIAGTVTLGVIQVMTAIVFLRILFALNSYKKDTLTTVCKGEFKVASPKGAEDIVTVAEKGKTFEITEEIRVPRFSPFISDSDSGEAVTVRVIASLICVVVILVCVFNI